MTRAIFGGTGVGLLGRSRVCDLGADSVLMPLSSVDNSCITRVAVEGEGTGGCCLVSFPRWFLACDQV